MLISLRVIKMRFLILFVIFGSAISFRIDEDALIDNDVSPLDMTYYFYSLENPDVPVKVKSNKIDAMKNTHFDSSKETVILIHGWGNDSQGILVTTAKPAIIAGKHDVNIIALDWSPIWKNYDGYEFLNRHAPKAGGYIAEFLKILVKNNGLQFSKLTLVGHSAGGPMSAAIGTALNSKVNYIIALDTSGVNKTHAVFVEHIHTTSWSTSEALGHVDYFPNGGINQTGCPDWTCGHYRAIDYYAESLNSKKFIGRRCDSYEDYKSGKCSNKPIASMGGISRDIAMGKYFLDTNGASPYAKG